MAFKIFLSVSLFSPPSISLISLVTSALSKYTTKKTDREQGQLYLCHCCINSWTYEGGLSVGVVLGGLSVVNLETIRENRKHSHSLYQQLILP